MARHCSEAGSLCVRILPEPRPVEAWVLMHRRASTRRGRLHMRASRWSFFCNKTENKISVNINCLGYASWVCVNSPGCIMGMRHGVASTQKRCIMGMHHGVQIASWVCINSGMLHQGYASWGCVRGRVHRVGRLRWRAEVPLWFPNGAHGRPGRLRHRRAVWVIRVCGGGGTVAVPTGGLGYMSITV